MKLYYVHIECLNITKLVRLDSLSDINKIEELSIIINDPDREYLINAFGVCDTGPTKEYSISLLVDIDKKLPTNEFYVDMINVYLREQKFKELL